MKKTTTTLALFCSFCSAFCQDIITTRDGEDLETKILRVGTEEVEYKRMDNPDGPVFTLRKSDILLIRYANGTHDVFEETPGESNSFRPDMFAKGQSDAMLYYKSYQGAGTGTLLTSLLSPLVGLIPAIACSATPPTDDNLGFPSAEYMRHPEYYQGYTMRAKKIKSGKVWKNWGIALGVNFVAVLIITSSQ